MVRRAFPAEVTNGQLCFQVSLADLEGQRVMVTLDDDQASPVLQPCGAPTEPAPSIPKNEGESAITVENQTNFE